MDDRQNALQEYAKLQQAITQTRVEEHRAGQARQLLSQHHQQQAQSLAGNIRDLRGSPLEEAYIEHASAGRQLDALGGEQ